MLDDTIKDLRSGQTRRWIDKLTYQQIAAHVQELEEKVERYEEVLDVLSRPANWPHMSKSAQRLCEEVFIQKRRVTDWSNRAKPCRDINCGTSHEVESD